MYPKRKTTTTSPINELCVIAAARIPASRMSRYSASLMRRREGFFFMHMVLSFILSNVSTHAGQRFINLWFHKKKKVTGQDLTSSLVRTTYLQFDGFKSDLDVFLIQL